jgi:hypothetical protein
LYLYKQDPAAVCKKFDLCSAGKMVKRAAGKVSNLLSAMKNKLAGK